LVGAATKLKNTSFVMTKVRLLRKKRKKKIVATNTSLSQQILSRQNYVCHGKHTFDMTEDVFCHGKHVCHDKHMFVMTNACLSQQK